MKCPHCDLELKISHSEISVSGDSSPDTTTRVLMVQKLSCRNPQCQNFDQVVATKEHLIWETPQQDASSTQ